MTTGRLLGGAILILLGGLLLAANYGYVDWGFFVSLWYLWPLLLIIVGVQLLFGRRQPWLAALLTLVIIAAGLALVVFGDETGSWFPSGQVETTQIDGPSTDGVREAEARIDVGAARLILGPGSKRTTVTGTFESRRTPTIDHQTSDDRYRLQVSQEGGWYFFPSNLGRDELNLELATGIPWKIDVNTGAADVDIDLSDVTLADLTIDAGASSVDLTVGRDVIESGASVLVDGGAGSYHVRLPEELDIRLNVDAGVSSVDVDSGFRRSGDDYRHEGDGNELQVRLKAGVSSVTVELY
jgi:hypothetical protein